jgi:hypothetical protein
MDDAGGVGGGERRGELAGDGGRLAAPQEGQRSASIYASSRASAKPPSA